MTSSDFTYQCTIKHGRMNCIRCWPDTSVDIQESGAFRLVRDPGHWGSTNPTTLVLGISKGNTQASAFVADPFDEVAFKGIRHRLLQVLQVVGLLADENLPAFERRFRADEREFAFASVLRCSMTGMDRKKGVHTSDSPNVAPAFIRGSAGYRFTSACVDQHLGKLPPTTKRVILLGTTDAYVDNLRELIARTRGGFSRINAMAFRAGGVLFVNVCHPSKGNGYFGAYLRGEGQSGQKKAHGCGGARGCSITFIAHDLSKVPWRRKFPGAVGQIRQILHDFERNPEIGSAPKPK